MVSAMGLETEETLVLVWLNAYRQLAARMRHTVELAKNARIEAKRLRTALETILEEAETDCDRDIIITESRSALGAKREEWRW